MTKSFNVAGSSARTRYLSVAAFVLALGLHAAPAAAEEGLFDFDPGKWMSSQRYNDNLKKHPPKEEEAEKPDVAPPALPVETEAKTEPVPEPPPKVEDKRILSKYYSYSPPPMPGVNNGFTVRVTSTNDPDAAEKPPSVATIRQADEEDAKPKEITLPDNWKAPTNMSVSGNDDDADKEKPLNVRMSVLPTPSTVPAPVAGQDRSKRVRFQAKKPEKTKEQLAQEKAACDAFEKLKKQQLDAIQSDRETLKALQDAVHSLGLAKKMDFRPEDGSVLMGLDEDTVPLVPRGTPVPKGR